MICLAPNPCSLGISTMGRAMLAPAVSGSNLSSRSENSALGYLQPSLCPLPFLCSTCPLHLVFTTFQWLYILSHSRPKVLTRHLASHGIGGSFETPKSTSLDRSHRSTSSTNSSHTPLRTSRAFDRAALLSMEYQLVAGVLPTYMNLWYVTQVNS